MQTIRDQKVRQGTFNLTCEKIKHKSDVLTQNVASFDCLSGLAEKYMREKEYLLCFEILDKIGEIFGAKSQLYLNKALCLYRLGGIKAAITCLEGSIKIDLSNEEAFKLLQMLKDRLGQMRDYTMTVYS